MEVLANGLPLWQAAQAAVDTTFVSPIGWPGLRSAGGCGARAGQGGGGTPEQTTYPDLLAARRCRLAVLAVEVGGRFGTEMVDFLRRLAVSKARAAPQWPRAATAGQACWLLPRSGHSPCHSWSCRRTGQTNVTGRSPRWQTCWRRHATCTQWLKAACRCGPEAASAA